MCFQGSIFVKNGIPFFRAFEISYVADAKPSIQELDSDTSEALEVPNHTLFIKNNQLVMGTQKICPEEKQLIWDKTGKTT